MNKILILFAHPAFGKSRINKRLIEEIKDLPEVTIHDLYENYPDFYIKVKKEQKLLLEHDIIIWHHPFYWYSAPAIIKEWMDLVLEHGFAYGREGRFLEGKKALSVITTGGKKEVYNTQGRNHYTVNQFLAPFHQAVNLCKMTYLPPFVVHGSHTMDERELKRQARMYRDLLNALKTDSIDPEKWSSKEYANELFENYV